jgi:DNA-binding XRE family transcriptional regulator
MTQTMNVQRRSSLLTTPSTSPVIKSFVYPFNVVNPESKAENVLVLVDRVVHAPLPAGYREIDDIVRSRESNPRHAAALVRARQRLAVQVENESQETTIASLRLRAGLSQSKIAELLGNSQSSYSLIESGRRDILHSTFEKLAAILHVSRDELAIALANTQEQAS